VLGDFNVQLPNRDQLDAKWYRAKGFNTHGRIAYDFISANNMLVADFMFPQKPMTPCPHTYFCAKRNVYTWIDHIVTSDYDSNSIEDCQIIPLEAGNVSDHLPIQLTFYISVHNTLMEHSPQKHKKQHNIPKWSSDTCNRTYKLLLEEKLHGISPLALPSETSREDVQRKVDDYVNIINDTLHATTQKAGCVYKKQFKPKPYWCPELNKLKDKKRFWWQLWVSNGRPREGAVFECYKGTKRLFRKTCRQNITN
jgi:hypothetical protein